MRLRNLERMMAPRSVALVDAGDPATAAAVAARLGGGRFEGAVAVVGDAGLLPDRPHAAAPGALDPPPDLAVIAGPPAAATGALRALSAAGAAAAVVTAETPTDGDRVAMRRAAGAMRLLGPDSLGLQLPHLGLDASFAQLSPEPGPLGLISQSNAIVTAMIDWAQGRGVGFSATVALGDTVDIDVGEMLDMLALDYRTRAILLYLETVRDARGFMSAARAAARVKPVIVAHGGQDDRGRAVYAAAFRRAGLLQVDDLEEMLDAAEVLARRRPPRAGGLAVATNAAGAGVLAVDAMRRADVAAARLAPDALAGLSGVRPGGPPVDVLGDADQARWRATLDAVIADPGVGGVLAIAAPSGLADPMEAARATIAADAAQKGPVTLRKPVIAAMLGSATMREAVAVLEAAGVPVYASPGQAVEAYGYLTGHARALAALTRTPPGLPEDREPDRAAARALIDAAMAEGRDRLTEPEAAAALAAYGAPVAPGAMAADPAGVHRLAAEMLARDAGALAVKVISRDLDSKSDIGGVRLNLAAAVEARDAAQAMLAQAARRAPDARIDGLLVQPMLRKPGGHELLLAVETDPAFGPVVIFGRGGLSVEVVADKALALPPLDMGLARDLIEDTRTGRLMRGGRGLSAVDLDAVALTLVRLAQMAADLPQVSGVEVNPLLAGADGCVALDARVMLTPAAPCAPGANPRFAIRPFPSDWDRTETVKGRPLRMRPIRPEDEALYPDFLQAVDPADMRLRFFSAIARPDHAMIARLTQIDYARAMAFVAINPGDGALLGVSRLAVDPLGREAEYAVLVRSDLKGRGVGIALMRRLIAYAKAEGLAALYGDVMDGNEAMLGVCAKLGFVEVAHPDDPDLRRVRLPLEPD